MSFVLKVISESMEEKEMYVDENGKACKELIDAKPFNSQEDVDTYIAKKGILNVEVVEAPVAYGYMNYFSLSRGFGFIKTRGVSYYAHISGLISNPNLEYPYKTHSEDGIIYRDYIVPRGSLVKYTYDPDSDENDKTKKAVTSFRICKLGEEKEKATKENKELTTTVISDEEKSKYCVEE